MLICLPKKKIRPLFFSRINGETPKPQILNIRAATGEYEFDLHRFDRHSFKSHFYFQLRTQPTLTLSHIVVSCAKKHNSVLLFLYFLLKFHFFTGEPSYKFAGNFQWFFLLVWEKTKKFSGKFVWQMIHFFGQETMIKQYLLSYASFYYIYHNVGKECCEALERLRKVRQN